MKQKSLSVSLSGFYKISHYNKKEQWQQEKQTVVALLSNGTQGEHPQAC